MMMVTAASTAASTASRHLRYNSLGVEQYPGELIPNVAADGKMTLTPFGDRKASCCATPADQVRVPREEADKQDEETDPRVFAVVAAVEEGEPRALKNALKAIEDAPEKVKADVKAALDAMKDTESSIPGPQTPSPSSGTPSVPPQLFPPSPSPSAFSSLEEAKAPSPSASSQSRKPGLSSPSRAPSSPFQAPSPALRVPVGNSTTPDARVGKGGSGKTTNENYLDDSIVENELESGPNTLAFGQSLPALVSPGGKALFKLHMPPAERAPLNLHFVVSFRDVPMRGCDNIVMRLRKYCGDRVTSPDTCDYPNMKHFSAGQGVHADVVREKSSSPDAHMAAIESLGTSSRIEWFEENPYTRKLSLRPGFDCGCERKLGEDQWASRGNVPETWWVEVSNNERPSSVGTPRACDFMLRVHAVDICSGHGDYIPHYGCKCDRGYRGQYRGPVSLAAAPDQLNRLRLSGKDDEGPLSFGKTVETEMWTHMMKPTPPRLQKVQSHSALVELKGTHKILPKSTFNDDSTARTTALVREAIARSTTHEHPIESAPGEVGGTFGEQDNHQLGCTEDERAPVLDPRMVHRLKMAKRAADGFLAENGAGIENSAPGGAKASNALVEPPILGKPLPEHGLLHDDCSGTLTVNIVSVMSDAEIVACTGRTRDEILAGGMYSDKAANAAARQVAEEKRGQQLDTSAWAPKRTEKVVVGEVAAKELEVEKEKGHDGDIVEDVSKDVPPVSRSYINVEKRMGLEEQ